MSHKGCLCYAVAAVYDVSSIFAYLWICICCVSQFIAFWNVEINDLYKQEQLAGAALSLLHCAALHCIILHCTALCAFCSQVTLPDFSSSLENFKPKICTASCTPELLHSIALRVFLLPGNFALTFSLHLKTIYLRCTNFALHACLFMSLCNFILTVLICSSQPSSV